MYSVTTGMLIKTSMMWTTLTGNIHWFSNIKERKIWLGKRLMLSISVLTLNYSTTVWMVLLNISAEKLSICCITNRSLYHPVSVQAMSRPTWAILWIRVLNWIWTALSFAERIMNGLWTSTWRTIPIKLLHWIRIWRKMAVKKVLLIFTG